MKEIILTKGQIALVDEDDYEYLKQWKWHASKRHNTNNYDPVRMNRNDEGKQRPVKMARVIMKALNSKKLVDHIDHNPLNNQKSNLRLTTRKGNQRNVTSARNSSSEFLGVSIMNSKKGISKKPYYARIRVNGKLIHLGCFNCNEEAAKAYDKAAKRHFKEFANLNFK